MTKKITKVTGKVDAKDFVAKNGFPTEFADQKTLQKFYKQLDTAQIEEWVAKLGLTFNPNENESIHRMRACMAVLYNFYPKETKTAGKAKSKYADYTTEALIALAIENDLALDVCDDMRIMRMRAIMGLRNIKVID